MARDFRFYLELFVITVLSIVSANAWTTAMNSFLHSRFSSHTPIFFTTAMILTLLTLLIVYFTFSGKMAEEENNNGNQE